MNEIEKVISYCFKNKKLLKTALTHSSYANEVKNGLLCNERLEFLGDSVLSIIVAEFLYKNYLHLPEGELTKLRASLVCEKSLFEFAMQIDLGEKMLLGRGEEQTGGRTRPSILADAFEALIAAIYLDGGIEAAGQFVLSFVTKTMSDNEKQSFKDYKTILQEIIQQNKEEKVEYVLVSEEGPDHDKRFCVEVRLNSNIIGSGTGRSKKQAEQLAAKEALELMGE